MQVSVVHLLIISQWNTEYFWLEMGFIATCEETFESVWPQHTNLYANSILGYLWVLLVKALRYIFRILKSEAFFQVCHL